MLKCQNGYSGIGTADVAKSDEQRRSLLACLYNIDNSGYCLPEGIGGNGYHYDLMTGCVTLACDAKANHSRKHNGKKAKQSTAKTHYGVFRPLSAVPELKCNRIKPHYRKYRVINKQRNEPEGSVDEADDPIINGIRKIDSQNGAGDEHNAESSVLDCSPSDRGSLQLSDKLFQHRSV